MRKKILKSRKKFNKLLPLIFSCLFILTFVSISFASGGEEHTPLWKEYMWKIINFLILVIILFKFGKKPLQNFLKQRTEMIAKTLQDAKEAKEAAQKALAEVETRLKAKDAEIAAILEAARKSGEQERDTIIAETDKLKAKIMEQAKTNIEFELKQAKELIKAEAVELAMELAEKKLKEKLTKEEQERLLEDSLVKIGGKG
ncbi:MAG: F0F1 ATP synthase subunit B [Nitrospirae bacterium]|jgi:F-type H+-transporting ATPase subunit b|nr:F0F1 ATP synthase subunit B [Nitrospirota bacterium]